MSSQADNSYIADLIRETSRGSLVPVDQRFSVILYRCIKQTDNGPCSLEALTKRVGSQKTKEMLGRLAWAVGKYLWNKESNLYKFGVDKMNLLMEIFREKKWPLSLLVDKAAGSLELHFGSLETATKKVKEVMGLCTNKVGSKKKKTQTPKDQLTSINPEPPRPESINRELAGEVDLEANRYLTKRRPRGWNAELGKEKEEADKKSTELMIHLWTVMDEPIFRTARGGTPVKKSYKKDGLTNASTKQSPSRSNCD